jgi:dethiobiotin synthetase
MKLPVLVVAQNRLGCFNHAALIVRGMEACELRCADVLLNSTEITGDIAGLTNADILTQILNGPLLAGLGERLTELPVDWRLMLDSTRES